MRRAAPSFVVVLFFFVCAPVFAGYGQRDGQKYGGPRCIAGLCFDGSNRISEEELVSLYGAPSTAKGVYCYRVPDQSLFVRFEASHVKPRQIVEVFVSKVQNCLATFSETVQPKTHFKEFTTPEGIALGDPYSKVISIYGPSTSEERGTGLEMRGLKYNKALNSAPFGDRVLIYSGTDNELLNSSFYLRDGKVCAILISANE